MGTQFLLETWSLNSQYSRQHRGNLSGVLDSAISCTELECWLHFFFVVQNMYYLSQESIGNSKMRCFLCHQGFVNCSSPSCMLCNFQFPLSWKYSNCLWPSVRRQERIIVVAPRRQGSLMREALISLTATHLDKSIESGILSLNIKIPNV